MPSIGVGKVQDDIRLYPAGAVVEYMGRRMPGRAGSVLGNPFKIRKESARAESVVLYEKWLREQLAIIGSPQSIEIARLERITKRGDDLVLLCWCRSFNETEPPCHCDVIAKIIRERIAD